VLQGTRLYVQGRLNTESWDDRRSGQKRYRMSVVAEKLIVLERGKGTMQPSLRRRQKLHQSAPARLAMISRPFLFSFLIKNETDAPKNDIET
jgi:single-stranded DNA-binding protein